MIGYENWGLALVHFVWQGLLVAAVLAVLLRTLAETGSNARYAVSAAALVLMAALPVITVLGLEAGSGTAASVGERPSFLIDGPAVAPAAENGVAVDEDLGAAGTADALVQSPSGLGMSDRLAQRFFDWARTTLRPLLAWIVAVWMLGVLLLSIRLLGGWVRLRRLTRLDISPVPASVRESARVLAARMAVSRPVRLVRSARVVVPAVVGWVRPVVLLPASALAGLTPAQLEAILAHEFAHIRRHDYLVNVLQAIIETVLFYHPAVWWVSNRVREEREHCCDDLAIAVCGDRRLYAGALIELETLRRPPARLAVAATGGSLVTRVRRMLVPPSPARDRVPRWSAALSAGIVGCAMAAACVGGPLMTAPPVISLPGSWYTTPGDGGAATAMVFIGEAFADKVFRYEVSVEGEANLDHEITTNVKQPGGIAFSPTGEMFVSNRTGSVARYLDPEGTATPNGLITAAESGAPFGQPHWLTFRGDELFLAQASGEVLRFIFDRSGDAAFNGRFAAGASGRGIQVRPATGELFVSNLDNAIHRFSFNPSGDASPRETLVGAGSNLHGMTFTPWGELLVADYFSDRISRFTFDEEGMPVPNGVIHGGDMAGPIDLDFSPWGELFVTNHNQVPGLVTRWTFDSRDAESTASYNGSFMVPGNLGGIQFAGGRRVAVNDAAADPKTGPGTH